MVDRADIDYIKNMAKDVCHLDRNCDECNMAYECKAIDYATRFYNAHYRKTEWISVYERLPRDNERVLCFDSHLKESALGAISVQFGWCCKRRNMSVTHWMPLPEAPNRKGGETDA